MKVMAIIPARGGSKGVPGKNVKLLAGHPLIAHSIQAAKLSKLTDRVVVSTDSEEIAAVARKYGAEVPFLRPAEISGDRSTDYEFVAHALEWFQKNEGSIPDFLVHLRPTTPLRDPKFIDEAIQKFSSGSDFTALRSVHQMSESAYKSFEISEQILKSVGNGSTELDAANNARQAFPSTYYGNGYVDILKSSFVLKEKRIHGGRVMAFVTPVVTEVDTLSDFDYLEYQAQKISKSSSLFER